MFQIRFASVVLSVVLFAFGRQSSASATSLVSVFALTSYLVAQVQPPEVEWQKTFGGASQDVAYSVQQTTDGGYILAGYTGSFGNCCRESVYLVKTDEQGNVVWQKILFGGQCRAIAFAVQQTADGGYLVAGSTDCPVCGSQNCCFLLKTDAQGNVWKWFGEGSCFAAQQTTDGGYVIMGSSESWGAGGEDVSLLKIDQQGTILWQKRFGGDNLDCGYAVQQTRDGGFVIAGYTQSFGDGGDVFLVKTDEQGNLEWQKNFGGANREQGNAVKQTADGGYIVAGAAEVFGDVYLLKTNNQGNLVWEKTFSGAALGWGYAVQSTTDGGYVVGGFTQSDGPTQRDAYLFKIDGEGNLLWQKMLGGSGFDECLAVQQTTDGGYIMAGYTNSFGAGNLDVYLIKLGPDHVVEYQFIRGDSNADGEVNITDPIVTLTRLFLDDTTLLCMDAADADDSGVVEITDAIYLLGFLYLGGPAPAAPFPDVGLDPTPDLLGCNLKPATAGRQP